MALTRRPVLRLKSTHERQRLSNFITPSLDRYKLYITRRETCINWLSIDMLFYTKLHMTSPNRNQMGTILWIPSLARSVGKYYHLLNNIMSVLSIISAALPAIVLNFGNIQPTIRGFFCDDESIRYPYNDSTISTVTLIIVSILLNLILVSFQFLVGF